jgi:DNA-binding transcriptional MerR regulator/methylmalonyl-CoA mutase cobalamin-binding subunit
MNNLLKFEDYLSIGELSRQTGIGVHTLRVWEKRYGTPISERLPSGHRRYPKEEVPRLKAIARALESGYRASKVVTGTLEELQGLLGAQNFMSSGPEQPDAESGQVSRELIIEKWIEAIHQYNDESLDHGFYEVWNKEGPLNFILNYSAPFVGRIGNGWANGELTVGQEHFATSHLSDFLSSKWRQLNIRKDGPTAVLATLPEETHNLGLLMCAVVTSLADFKVVYLGPNSPVEDILKTIEHSKAQLLCLSISNCVEPKGAKEQLRQIRKALDKKINMIIGGEGASDAAPGIARLNNFSDYYQWISQLNI